MATVEAECEAALLDRVMRPALDGYRPGDAHWNGNGHRLALSAADKPKQRPDSQNFGKPTLS